MPGSAGVICNSGVCSSVTPETALALIAIGLISEELSKGSDAFGPNNELIKILSNARSDIINGPGDNNEIVKVIRNAYSDLQHGLGPNNEIRRLFENLGVKL